VFVWGLALGPSGVPFPEKLHGVKLGLMWSTGKRVSISAGEGDKVNRKMREGARRKDWLPHDRLGVHPASVFLTNKKRERWAPGVETRFVSHGNKHPLECTFERAISRIRTPFGKM